MGFWTLETLSKGNCVCQSRTTCSKSQGNAAPQFQNTETTFISLQTNTTLAVWALTFIFGHSTCIPTKISDLNEDNIDQIH